MHDPAGFTVFCFCAAWCRTCDAYVRVFETLAHDRRAQSRWVWLDIEEHADVIGDVEVENFPTLLIADARSVCFFGPVLPQAGVAARLFDSVTKGQGTQVLDPEVEALRQRLFAQVGP